VTPIDQCSFEQLVGEALDSLPAEPGKLMDNVAIVVEDRHHEMGLLGIYEGIPLTERDNYGYMATPDLTRLSLSGSHDTSTSRCSTPVATPRAVAFADPRASTWCSPSSKGQGFGW